jgi:S1-C subfamily serine protease
MLRFTALFVSAWLATSLCRAGDDSADLKSALALQKVMQKVIADVEPAVACILVSRSDAYQRHEIAFSSPAPGKLGGVDSRTWADEKRKKLDLSDPDHVPESFGSGVVIDRPEDQRAGLVLTNYHVVRDAAKVFVRLPGGKGSYADIHAADPRSDLAVLRLLNPGVGLKVMPFGDAGKCARGQFVLSIANPYAVGFRDGQPSASWGILSNIRRRAPADPREPREEYRSRTLHHYGTLLQTDARLNLGCSGGALVNLRGEMIGLTTALAAIHGGETPGGFAVPLDPGMRRIIGVLQRGEEVEYGFLGVAQAKSGKPAAVGAVTPGSAAERQAHLQQGDVIAKINDRIIGDWDDLLLALGMELAGSKVRLEVQRFHGGARVVEVELAKLPIPGKKIASSLGRRDYFRGLRVDYTSVLAVEQMSPVQRGVLISEIKPFSTAARTKLKSGEIITLVNGREVNKPADFYAAVAVAMGPVELTLAAFSNTPPPKVTLPP